jgi:hypothetical protein
MGVWQGVAMDSLDFHPCPPCLTLLRPAGGPPLKQPYNRFRGADVFFPFGQLTPYAYAYTCILGITVPLSTMTQNASKMGSILNSESGGIHDQGDDVEKQHH